MNLTCQAVVFRVSGRSDWHNQNITHSLLDQNAPNNELHHNDDQRHAQWEEPLSAVLMVWNVHRSTLAETKQRLMSCKIINGQMATSFSQFEVLGEHETDLMKKPLFSPVRESNHVEQPCSLSTARTKPPPSPSGTLLFGLTRCVSHYKFFYVRTLVKRLHVQWRHVGADAAASVRQFVPRCGGFTDINGFHVRAWNQGLHSCCFLAAPRGVRGSSRPFYMYH